MSTKITDYTGKPIKDCTSLELFNAVLNLTTDKAKEVGYNQGKKKLYYISAEFLIGKLLSNNLINLGIYDDVKAQLAAAGRNITELEEFDYEPSLGNGGLGRLAACFIDSLATLGLPADGVGIAYHCGLFKQSFDEGKQYETPDYWLKWGHENWMKSTGKHYTVHFGGFDITSTMYEIDVTGYGSKCGKLRLFDTDTVDERLIKKSIDFDKTQIAKNLTLFLYPDDSDDAGRILRVYQEYFMCANAAQLILEEAKAKGSNLHDLADYAAIQINDTHPTLIIPELMRLLLDDDGLGWDEAWAIVTACVNYTNHTVMSEALETWPQGLIQSQLPRVWEIICEINRRWCDELRARFGDDARVGRNLIIADGSVHMANLCLAACKTINGVSALHGEILRRDLFRDVCALDPSRFTYVTNGIDHRRWLAQCNPGLHKLVCDVLGSDRYLLHPEELAGLERAANDPAVLARLEEIKALNKQRLAAWVFRTDGFSLNSDAILDVQVKRLHEYKRQLLCAMRITQLQLMLHDDPDQPFQPRTFLFAAKAAPGYATAKRIIQLLCSLAADVNADPVCRGRLQVYFLPNYRVSAAEMLMPAAQVSEQISTAGKEASGTGNMKLMMNGAVTIGTLDGANVEMFEQLGADNMFLFGLHADEAEALRAAGYDPQAYVRRSPWLGRVLERMSCGYADGESYADLVSSLLYGGDPYLLLADFDDYAATHERLYATIADPAERARLSLVNIARSGIFAADRAVREYAERIWEVHA